MKHAYYTGGRLISPLFILFLRIFTLLFGVERVRVIVINEKMEVLLVRGVISDGKWSLPGGGVARGERPAAAARRELLEETGIDVPEKEFIYKETMEKSETHVPYRAPLFIVHVNHSLLPEKPVNPWEIAELGWFAINDLPRHSSRLTTIALTKYKNRI